MIEYDITELLARIARRERALAAGSKHTGPDGPRWQGKRADAVSELDAPELRYPSQWGARPHRCPNCGAGRASFETKPPYGLVKRGESACFVCSRVVVRWKADGTRAAVGTPAPETPPCLECDRPRVGNHFRCLEHTRAYRRQHRSRP